MHKSSEGYNTGSDKKNFIDPPPTHTHKFKKTCSQHKDMKNLQTKEKKKKYVNMYTELNIFQ